MTTMQQHIFQPKPDKIITPLDPKPDPLDVPVIPENELTPKRRPKPKDAEETC